MHLKFFNLGTWNNPNRNQRFFLISVFLIFCLAVLTRYQLLNGFTLLSGDKYDSVIITAILEHWFKFFSGDANWSEMNYFFPYTRTIAQTDAFFLIGVAYFPFRFFGLDMFLSTELASLVIKSSGFIGIYLLSRKVFSFSFYWALLAAVLFTLSNGMTVHSSRVQLATVAFSPIMATLLWCTVKAFLDDNLVKFRRTGMITGLFFGAWCLTCFYMAWFFTFFFTVFMAVILVKGGRDVFLILKQRLVAHYGSVILVVATTLISLLPFIYAFLPKSREVGVRSYESASSRAVPLEGILQVGSENFMFGGLYNFILSYISPSYTPRGEYYNTGFSIVLFVLFVCGCIKVMRRARQQSTDFILVSLVIATLITWVSVLSIYGHSAWFFVYYMFPGAKALNVISAYQLFLALPVVIIAIKYLSMQRISLPIVMIITALLVVEEINQPYFNLDRKVELARVSLPHLPPEECKVFYTSGWKDQTLGGASEWADNYYAHNVSAILIAQIARIPTVNGIASFNPPDWKFAYPNAADYDQRLLSYSNKHGITGLCRLDLNSKQWQVVNDSSIENVTIDSPFFKKSVWTGGIVDAQGLSYFETWGAWSSSDVVTFIFNRPLPEKFNVHLTAHAFGPNVGKEFLARVGDRVVKFSLGTSDEDKVLEFDNPTRSKILTINVPFPISPKELDLGGDKRTLGIAFVQLSIVPL